MNPYFNLLLSQIIYFTLLVVFNNKIFNIIVLMIEIKKGSRPVPVLSSGNTIGSLISILTIILPAFLNMVILCYLYLKNDDKINNYINTINSNSVYIVYFPLVVSGFLIKSLNM